MLVIVLSLLPSCSQTNVLMKISMNVEELSLVNMWEEAVQITGIQEQSAYLHSFQLWTDRNGKLYNPSFSFNKASDNGTNWTHYGFRFNENGELLHISTSSSESDNSNYIKLTYNPRVLFREVEKMGGLRYIQSTCSEFSIKVEPGHYASPEQDYWEFTFDQNMQLYHLSDGDLIPLRHVKIANDQPFLPIQIDKTIADASRHPEIPFEIWLLSEDLAKAEIVEEL